MNFFKRFFRNCCLVFIISSSLQKCAPKKDIVINSKNVIATKNNGIPSGKKIIYMIDNKEVTEDFLMKIKKSEIESINVVKEKKEILKYTPKKVEGILIIKMKN